MKLFSTAEAAKYLGLSISAIKHHIYNGNLDPIKVGNSLVFSQRQLDFFLANRRGPGRPKKTDEPITSIS